MPVVGYRTVDAALFSLGEDRFLTILLTKHFPTFKTKFCSDAVAHTVAPESGRILFSRRRKWISSTRAGGSELCFFHVIFRKFCFT